MPSICSLAAAVDRPRLQVVGWLDLEHQAEALATQRLPFMAEAWTGTTRGTTQIGARAGPLQGPLFDSAAGALGVEAVRDSAHPNTRVERMGPGWVPWSCAWRWTAWRIFDGAARSDFELEALVFHM
jgi:hypothetical protein